MDYNQFKSLQDYNINIGNTDNLSKTNVNKYLNENIINKINNNKKNTT